MSKTSTSRLLCTCRDQANARPARRRGLAGCVAVAWALGACHDDSIWLGQNSGGINLEHCVNAECGSQTSDMTSMPAAQACVGVGSGTVGVALQVELQPVVCPDLVDHGCSLSHACTQEELAGQVCSLNVLRTISAPDGAAYVLGTRNYESGETLWLAHYDAAGNNLVMNTIGSGGALEAGGRIRYGADLSVDAAGHAFVLVYESDGGPNADAEVIERAWIGEYGADLGLLKPALPVAGVGAGYLAIDASGDLAVAGNARSNAKHGVLAELDQAGVLRFNQTGVRSYGSGEGAGVIGVSLDSQGVIGLAAQRTWHVNQPVTFGFARYGSDGTLLWDRALDTPFANGELADFCGDSQGRMALAGIPDSSSQTITARVLGVDSAGNARFAYDLDSFDFDIETHAESGRVYVFDAKTLMEIAADGSSCVHYALPAGFEGGAFSVASDGELYYAGPRKAGRLHITASK
ncbi:MAG: hypothetical protein JWN04_6592 [Myxococcaceae bacterium]|nr:hypothetical protein [Myxococcaceae bacterium]